MFGFLMKKYFPFIETTAFIVLIISIVTEAKSLLILFLVYHIALAIYVILHTNNLYIKLILVPLVILITILIYKIYENIT